MPPRKATAGRWSSPVVSPGREHSSFDTGSSGFDRNLPSVHPRTSLRGTASLLDDVTGYSVKDEQRWLGDQPIEDQNYKNDEIGRAGGLANPRSFSYSVKQQCWEKADKVKGRDPDRWRRDLLGNIIFRKLVGCPGCLCHDYDHIVPFSKGGKSTLDNCQVLQATVNRSKGNKTQISKSDLIQKSAYCRLSGRDMDLVELSAYGNVRRGQDSGGCNIQ